MKTPRTVNRGEPSYFVVSSTSGIVRPTAVTGAKASSARRLLRGRLVRSATGLEPLARRLGAAKAAKRDSGRARGRLVQLELLERRLVAGHHGRAAAFAFAVR